MTNKELFKAFAQGKERGKNASGSVFIDGNRLYSYGYHFIVAILDKGAKIATVTNRKYSVTTSKHTRQAFLALVEAGYSIRWETL